MSQIIMNLRSITKEWETLKKVFLHYSLSMHSLTLNKYLDLVRLSMLLYAKVDFFIKFILHKIVLQLEIPKKIVCIFVSFSLYFFRSFDFVTTKTSLYIFEFVKLSKNKKNVFAFKKTKVFARISNI